MSRTCAAWTSLLSVLLIAAITACGSRAGDSTAARTPPRLPLLPDLPSLAEVSRSVSTTRQYPTAPAVDWISASRVEAVNFDAQARFTPGGNSTLDEAAYAIYGFSVPTPASPAFVHCDWVTLPDSLWLGIADFAADAWRWYPADPASDFPLPAALSRNGAGAAFITVLTCGTNPAELSMLRIDREASLTATLYGNGTAPLSVDFHADYAYGFIGRYDWDFDGDGVVDVADGGQDQTHTYPSEGTYKATVLIYDPPLDDLYPAALDITVAGTNIPPVADIMASTGLGSPDTVGVNTDLYFYATQSIDPDGEIVDYAWDWDDDGVMDENSAFSGENPNNILHQFAAPDVYPVTVQVTDNQGATATATTDVYILGPPYDETEQNDTAAAADTLPAFPFTHFIGSTADGDQDWFKFTVAGGTKYLWLETHGYVNETDLYASDGTTMLASSTYADGMSSLLYQCTPGDYYIVRSTPAGWPAYDYFLAADLFTDFPAADLTAQKLTSEVYGPIILVTTLKAYDVAPGAPELSYGCQIDWDLDNDGHVEQGFPGILPLKNRRTVQAKYYQLGDTTAKVTVTPPVGAPTSSTFDIHVYEDGDHEEYEPNDVPGTAQSLELSGGTKMAHINWKHSVFGAIGDSSPGGSLDDWYRYDIPQAGTVKFYVDRWGPLTRFSLTILAADGSTVRASALVGNHEWIAIADYPVSGGMYYLHLQTVPAEPWNAGGYCLGGLFDPTGS
jgi:PKD repeat protein